MNDDFFSGLNGMPNGSFGSSVGFSIHSHNETQKALKTQADYINNTPKSLNTMPIFTNSSNSSDYWNKSK